jgi:RarD protein
MEESRATDYLLIAGAAVLWGSVGVFLRWVDLPGQEHFVVFVRSAVSAAFLAAVIALGGKRDELRPGKHPWLLLGSGVLLTLHWVLFLKALNRLFIGDAEFITYLAPVLVAFLAPLLLKEKLEMVTVPALFLALGGMALLSLTGRESGAGLLSAGTLFALFSAVSYAFLLLALKKLREDTSALTVSLYQTAINAVLLLPFCAFRSFPVSGRGWLSLIVLATVHTAIAGLVYVYAVKGVRAQHVGIIAYLEPVSAMIFGSLFLGEGLGWQDVVGGACIVAAGAMVLRRAWGAE